MALVSVLLTISTHSNVFAALAFLSSPPPPHKNKFWVAMYHLILGFGDASSVYFSEILGLLRPRSLFYLNAHNKVAFFGRMGTKKWEQPSGTGWLTRCWLSLQHHRQRKQAPSCACTPSCSLCLQLRTHTILRKTTLSHRSRHTGMRISTTFVPVFPSEQFVSLGRFYKTRGFTCWCLFFISRRFFFCSARMLSWIAILVCLGRSANALPHIFVTIFLGVTLCFYTLLQLYNNALTGDKHALSVIMYYLLWLSN